MIIKGELSAFFWAVGVPLRITGDVDKKSHVTFEGEDLEDDFNDNLSDTEQVDQVTTTPYNVSGTAWQHHTLKMCLELDSLVLLNTLPT